LKTNTHLFSYLARFLLEWDVSDRSCRENQNTHFIFSNVIFENLAFYEITSRGTRRCPGWPMTKPDSNFVYYVTKTGDGINCVNVSVKFAPCYIWKGPVLTQKHTRARRWQHREWIQCLILQLIGKQRYVTKLECYRLIGMSLKLFSPQEPECKCLLGFWPSSMQHTVLYSCPC
jgi:hypothetical protein